MHRKSRREVGFEGTAAIRQLKDLRCRSLPIVALTANAMQGDEQLCLDAGMNGFLAKPYALAGPHAALSQWLAASSSAEAGVGRPAMAVQKTRPGMCDSAINPRALETLKELDEEGSTELVTQLVTSFLGSAGANLERLSAAVAEGDARSAGQIAHSLKSGAVNLGAEALAKFYAEIEKCGRQGRLHGVLGLLEQTRREQVRALDELAQLLGVPV